MNEMAERFPNSSVMVRDVVVEIVIAQGGEGMKSRELFRGL